MAHVRLATSSDASELIEIYKQYIKTTITLEQDVPSVTEITAKIQSLGKNYPFIVVEDANNVVGYAFARRNLEQSDLTFNAELRVFIDLNQRGKGYGTVLLEAVIDILRLQGVCNVYSNITESNPRSLNIHRKLNFVHIGTLHKIGYKNDRWIDLNLYEKRIEDRKEPSKFIPLYKLEDNLIKDILDKSTAKLDK